MENSALALSRSATLMMMPGRLCDNGKPVPVDDEEVRARGAESLIVAGRAAYKAAQARNQDAILEGERHRRHCLRELSRTLSRRR